MLSLLKRAYNWNYGFHLVAYLALFGLATKPSTETFNHKWFFLFAFLLILLDNIIMLRASKLVIKAKLNNSLFLWHVFTCMFSTIYLKFRILQVEKFNAIHFTNLFFDESYWLTVLLLSHFVILLLRGIFIEYWRFLSLKPKEHSDSDL